MSEYLVKEKDIPTMIESLSELFCEYKNEVTPKMVAERMTAKLGRFVHFSSASFLLYSMGFITKPAKERCNRTKRFIIQDEELLNTLQRKTWR